MVAEVMDVAVIGCGFVADYYMATLAEHPGLRVVAAVGFLGIALRRHRRQIGRADHQINTHRQGRHRQTDDTGGDFAADR